MSSIGELFIEELQNIASDNNLINVDYEVLETEEEMYDIWNAKDLPKTGKIPIMGESEEDEFIEYNLEHIVDNDGEVLYNLLNISRDGREIKLQASGQVDYIEYLKPIIEDLKDGSTDPLTTDDVDYLMTILRAKISFNEGLIDEVEYLTVMNSVEL